MENDVASRMETVFYEESVPKKITYKWKGKFWFDWKLIFVRYTYWHKIDGLGGGAVDPECGLGDNVHVYSEKVNGKNVYYSVILSFVDIYFNKNSYYRLQLLESNGQKM